MTYQKLPRNTPALLRKHGLKVVEVAGWYRRGRPAYTGGLHPGGVLCHHTASSADGARGLPILINGRSDLPGPLCHFALSRNGTVYIVAAGRANHAGRAVSSGTMAGGDGNALYWGIEAMNRGTGERWPKAQYDAYIKLCAAISVEITHNSHNTVRAHKETSTTGKIDPFGPTPYEGSFSMNAFRSRVSRRMSQMKSGGGGSAPSTSQAAINRRVIESLTRIEACLQVLMSAEQEQAARAASDKTNKARKWKVATSQDNINKRVIESLTRIEACFRVIMTPEQEKAAKAASDKTNKNREW